MTAQELQTALDRLGLTGYQLAKELGVEKSTAYRWINGHLPVPRYAVAYLKLKEQTRL